MKPSETVKNYPSERRMYSNYVIRNIKKICKEFGPRCAGSEKEYEAQQWMADELKTTCDDVKIEDFNLAPWAFMSWVQLTVFCVTAATILLLLTHFLPQFALIFTAVAVGIVAVAFFFVITEFLLYKQTLDPFMKKKVSHNVIAVRKASGETKRRIVFSGHADSAPEWRFTYWGGPKFLLPVIGLGLGGAAYTLVHGIIALVFVLKDKPVQQGGALWILSIVNACLIPVFLVCLLFYDKKRIVDGANDNLTGCLVSMAVPRFMQDHDIRFENTEVMVICTGAEEAGLRGAKAFCKAHADEFKAEKDVETVFVCLDTIRDYEFMGIYHKDMTGTVKNSDEVSKLVYDAGKLCDLDIPYENLFFGSSDAAAITQAGLKATCFAAMDPAPARYYHTRLDTADNMELKTIEAGVDLCLNCAFLFDEKGLS